MMEFGEFEKTYFLSRCPAFEGLGAEPLAAVAGLVRAQKFEKEEKVLSASDPIDYLYILIFGELSIRVDNEEVNVVRVGNLVGDHEVLSGREDSVATVWVKSEYAWLFQMSRPEFLDILDREPSIAGQMARELGRRRADTADSIEEIANLSFRIKRDLDKIEASMDIIQRVAELRNDVPTETIEIRYIVDVNEDTFHDVNCHDIRQGYVALNEEDSSEIRVRDEGAVFTITGKRDQGSSRVKIDLSVDSDLFEKVFSFCGSRVITKKRYIKKHEGHTWRIDVFDADSECAGLAIAETEIHKGDAPPLPPPGTEKVRDITGDPKYRNQSLAIFGHSTWHSEPS